MAQTLLNPSIIAKEGLRILENELVMGNLSYREFRNEFHKVGDRISIRKPNKFIAKAGADITTTLQEVQEESITFILDQRWHIAWEFSSEELTLTIENYSSRYMRPAMVPLVNKVDYALTSRHVDIYQTGGAAGTTPATFAALGAAATKLDDASVPYIDRSLVLNPAANWSMADALKGLLDQEMVRSFVRKGKLGRIADMDIFTDQNVCRHTVGTKSGTPLTNGAGQTGASLITDGWGNSEVILKQGDIFTLTGVNMVNTVEKTDLGVLQQFVATADVTSDGSGNATVPISPSIIISGAKQTVTAAPGDGATITVTGTASTAHVRNLAFHKDCFGLVTVPLVLPDSVAFKARESYNGLTMRVIKAYDIHTDAEIIRFDILFGVKTLYPELGCILLG